MKIARRQFLHLSANAAALPMLCRTVSAASQSPPSAESHERPLAERLATYASNLRYDDLDALTLERVKTLVIDTIGCGIGAWEERPVRACREIALSVAGAATIIGTTRRTTPDLAAFANCAASRYLDFNDTYVGRFAAHPSDNIAACLAVAEAEGASAQELIVAIVIAYEVNCRLVDAFDISARGWDPPRCSGRRTIAPSGTAPAASPSAPGGSLRRMGTREAADEDEEAPGEGDAVGDEDAVDSIG